jgi:hypothetical protein
MRNFSAISWQVQGEFESHSGKVYSIQHYVIKFVSGLRQVGGFLSGDSIFLHQQNWPHDIAEKYLKVALNAITITPKKVAHDILIITRILMYKDELIKLNVVSSTPSRERDSNSKF